MFKKLIKSLGLRFGNQNPFDPSRFEDPIAMQTEWTPAKGGGANFCTHKMVQNGMGRLEFRASLGARLFYLVFASAGGAMFYFGTIPIVFDQQRGFYWKGRKAPYEMYNRAALKNYARLEDIHALQLISEYCHGNKSSYDSYELNLVLKDGRRLNVVDHGNHKQLRADAATLSRILDKPVWDAL